MGMPVDAALNRQSLMIGAPGIVLQHGGYFLPVIVGQAPPGDGVVAAGWAMLLVGTAMLIVGLGWYARAKGHSGWWGLMGLLSIVGLIVLAVLPDRLKRTGAR